MVFANGDTNITNVNNPTIVAPAFDYLASNNRTTSDDASGSCLAGG